MTSLLCNQSDLFLCLNGQCINRTAVCDGVDNCRDASDEDPGHAHCPDTSNGKPLPPRPDTSIGKPRPLPRYVKLLRHTIHPAHLPVALHGKPAILPCYATLYVTPIGPLRYMVSYAPCPLRYSLRHATCPTTPHCQKRPRPTTSYGKTRPLPFYVTRYVTPLAPPRHTVSHVPFPVTSYVSPRHLPRYVTR